MRSAAELQALRNRFLHGIGTGPGRYDDNLFEHFLEQEGVSPHDFEDDDLMALLEGEGLSHAEAREQVEQMGEWGPRRPSAD